MNGTRLDVLFSGNLTDPWVQALRRAIPAPTRVLETLDLPEDWLDRRGATILILHRGTLAAAECDRLRQLRERHPSLHVVLIVGPHARYHQIMAWSGLVDTILPEATAFEAIPRHLSLEDGARYVPDRPTPVAVVSGHWELGRMLVDILREAGYAPRYERDILRLGAEPWVIWDVPVLEPDWPELLAALARRRGVIAMLGLADRQLTATAHARGALACLDLPCDPEALVSVLDRISSQDVPPRRRRDAGHSLRSQAFIRRSQAKT